MSTRRRLHELVERLPEAASERASELLEALVEAPVDPKMLARIDAARRRRSAGIPHVEVLKEYGLSKTIRS